MPEEEALLVVVLLLVVGLLLVGGPLQVAALSEAALVLSVAVLSVVALSEAAALADLTVVALTEAAALADLTLVALPQEHRSSYVVRTPVNRYTRSDGYVVIIANGGYMGNERYYYDNVYGESVRNPAYRESNPLGGFLAFCCIVCCIICFVSIIGCCNAANN